MKLAVICSASDEIEKKDQLLAEDIFNILSRSNKYELVLGGSSRSLMKCCCESFNEENNHTTSIITKNNQLKEVQISKEVIVVENTTERTKKVLESADIIVALFGGLGSLREISVCLDMIREKELNGKLIIYNENNHYDKLFSWIEEMKQKGYIQKNISTSFAIVNTKKELMEILKIEEEEK